MLSSQSVADQTNDQLPQDLYCRVVIRAVACSFFHVMYQTDNLYTAKGAFLFSGQLVTEASLITYFAVLEFDPLHT